MHCVKLMIQLSCPLKVHSPSSIRISLHFVDLSSDAVKRPSELKDCLSYNKKLREEIDDVNREKMQVCFLVI